MNILKNKHLLIATLMAPVLGLIGYFGVNALVGEKPHAAEAGQSYQLVEKPNCRYSSGICGMKNVDFELTLGYEWVENDRMLLTLTSQNPLEGVVMALAESGKAQSKPVAMRSVGEDGMTWSLDIPHPDAERDRLHLVASSNGTLYFGDVAMKFTLVEADNYN